ncbi:MAG: chromosome partitioning protein [Chloroflexota bacterium]|jgi:chromosome partitioning protein|nr:chromosome partitioning protein [Chloroflexota bacterium]
MSGQAWRVAVIAGKGGVGKTTSVINLGAGLAALGRRVLLVDCDPQGNLTSGLGLDPYARRRTVADVIIGRCTAVEAILETDTPNLHLIPAHPDLSAVEADLPARVNAELRLRNAMREGIDAGYDVVLFDTPPNFGFHTISALGAARSALVPLQMSAFALRGLKEVIRVIAAARRHLNPELELLGVVPTFVNKTRFSRDMLEALGDVSQVRVFRSEISHTVKLQESALQGVPVLISAPSSNAARAYLALAEELVEVGAHRLAPVPRGAVRPADAAPAAETVEEAPEALAPVEAVAEVEEVETPEAPEPLGPAVSDVEASAPGVVPVHEPAQRDGELDDGFAVTLAGEASHGSVALATAGAAVHQVEGQPVRGRVMLELELGHGAVAYAQMPPMDLHTVDGHDRDEDPDHAGAEDGEVAAADAGALETASAERRRFRLFRRARAS